MKISIIIPVYNERGTIGIVLEKVKAVKLIDIKKEIIVVDGCSTDGTREFLLELCQKENFLLIREEQRLGKGMALRNAFNNLTGDIVLIQDADLETNPDEYPALLKPILEGKATVVYGSRFKKGRGKTLWGSYLGNWAVTLFMNLLFFSKLSDVATVYKVFKRDVIEDFNFECKGFDFDVEITVKILKSGNNILEIPISYNPRRAKDGKKLHWFVGIRALYLIFKYRFHD